MYPRLIDTGPIYYTSPEGLAQRPCRTWETSPHHALSIVTEPSDAEGRSVTNAAEEITKALRATRPHHLRVIEHYPDGPFEPEHYDEQLPQNGTMSWKRVPVTDLEQLLGPLLHITNPLGSTAVRWTGDNYDEVLAFANKLLPQHSDESRPLAPADGRHLNVQTATGQRRIQPGDYLFLSTSGLDTYTPAS